MQVRFDLCGLHAEHEAKLAVEHFLGHLPVAQLRCADVPARGGERLLLGVERFAQPQQQLTVVPGEDAAGMSSSTSSSGTRGSSSSSAWRLMTGRITARPSTGV